MARAHIIKLIGPHVRRHSYFGIASLLIGFMQAAISLLAILSASKPASAGYHLLETAPRAALLLFVNYFPILGPLTGVVGLIVDQEKVFAIIGVILMFAFFITFYVYAGAMWR